MKKPKLAYLMAVDDVIEDKTTKKLTFIGVFQRVSIQKSIGFTYINFVIVGRMVDVPMGNMHVEAQLLDHKGGVVASATATGNITTAIANIRIYMNNVKLEKTGIYSYQLLYEGEVYKTPDSIINVEAVD